MLVLTKICFGNNSKGQSAVELAIFGSILIFVISLIFRQALSGGNFMRVQLQATRYAMSKSLEMATKEKPGRNTGSTLVIEDRLSGDFANRFGSRDRVPLIASGSGTYTNQLFYPIEKEDFGEAGVLPYFDVWINGQRFSFTTAGFVKYDLPTDGTGFPSCGEPHKTDSRCLDGSGNVVLHKVVQNYPGSGFSSAGSFDVNFEGKDQVAEQGTSKDPLVSGAGRMAFMWQWQDVAAVGELSTEDSLDVDGDFQEEQILSSTVDPVTNRTASFNVIDRQAGDLDFTIDDRQKGVEVGLLPESQMFSFTEPGTTYRVQDGKLFDAKTSRYIRNTNINDQVDIVQRVFQLSNNTGRFCNGDNPRTYSDSPAWDGEPALNPVQACNNCFSGTNIQVTCFDTTSKKLYVRSRIDNKNKRSWLTRTEL